MQNLNELKLSERISQLENAIKTHRSQKADDRCIEDDDRLYEALGDGVKCDRRVGCKEDMLKNCQRFIENRCEGGGWPSYAELESKLNNAVELLKDWYERAMGKNYFGSGKPSTVMATEMFLRNF